MAKGKADSKKADGKKGAGDAKKGAGDAKKGADKEPRGAQSINVRHILCEKHARKEEALAQIRAGTRFDEVARAFSEDKARQGGALGWKTRGSLDPAFEAVAFGLAASTVAAPVVGEARTGFGYHVIMVEGRK